MEEELEKIVQKMIDAGEPESNIAKVIKEYDSIKPKTVKPKKSKAEVSGGLASPSAGIDSLWGSKKASPIEESLQSAINPTTSQLLEKMPDRGMSVRNRASRELRSQYESEGVKNYKITPQEIDKKAYEIAKASQPKEPAKNEEGGTYDFWDDTWKKVKSNTASAVAGVAGIPNLINKGFYYAFADEEDMNLVNSMKPEAREAFINAQMGVLPMSSGAMGMASAKVQEHFKGLSQNLQSEIHQFDTDLTDDIMNGDFSQAGKRVASEGIGSIPSLVQAMIPYVGIGSIVAGSASNKQEELEDEGYDLDGSSLSNSIINGAAEGVLELVTKKIGSKVFKAMDKVPEYGREPFMKSMVDNLIKDPAAEGASEASTSLIQDLSDKYVQGKEKDFNSILKTAMESGLVGGFVGGSLGATTTTIQRTKALVEEVKIDNIINSDSNDFKTVSDAFRFDTGSKLSIDQLKLASKTSILGRLEEQLKEDLEDGKINDKEASEIKGNLIKTQSVISKTMGIKMEDSKRVEAVNLINRKEVLKDEIKNMDEALATGLKEEVKRIDENLIRLTSPIVPTDAKKESTKESKPEVSTVTPERKKATLDDVVEASPEDYSSSMSTAVKGMSTTDNKINLQVDEVSLEDAKKIVEDGGKLFMTKDGKSGAYVKADGYMGGLFKDPTSNLKEVGEVLQQARIEAGGKYFDAYGTKLEDIYIKNGFVPVARVKFDEKFAPEGWDAEGSPLKDRPDNVYFAYDPNSDVKKGGGVVVNSHEEGLSLASGYEARTGKQNTEFFTGKAKEASSKIPYNPVIEVDQTTPVAQAYKKFSSEGNFTGHISKMIAGFAEKQKQVAEAIVKGGFKSFLDIGTSEGGMIKTVASQNPEMKAVGIDPNSQMKENFNATEEVPNAEFRQEAWQASWTDEDGTVINEFKPTEKFDVVNEDFAFQFMNNNREQQVKGVKEVMTPDGVFITSEKFHTDNQEANEQKKYDHQKKYFDASQLTEDKQTIVNGMADDMVRDTEYFNTLKKNFKFVEEFWNAGNFKGYIASDNKAKLDEFRSNVGDLSSEFTDTNSKTNEQNKEKGTTTTTSNKKGEGSSTVGDVRNEPKIETKERAKELADKIRGLKVNKDIKSAMGKLNSRPTALVEVAWDGAIEVVATTVELTGDLAQAIEKGLSTLKASKWYQGLSEKGQKMAERKYRDMFRGEIAEIELHQEKQGFFDKLNQSTGQKFVDIFTNINRALKDLNGFRDLYKREGLFESKAANEVEKMLNNVKDALGAISKSNYNVKQVSDFMYAKHALDRNAYIEQNVDEENPFGSGMLDIEANKILEQYSDSERKELEDLAKPFYDIIEDSRNRMVESGLISKEAMAELKSKDTTYVPLTGFADEQIELGQFVQSKKVNVKGSEFRKLTGRTTEANNILSNIIKQHTDVAVRASKNEVLQEFQKIKKSNPEGIVPFTIHTQESLPTGKSVNSKGKVAYTKDKAQIDDTYVGFKENGVQKYIKFENPVLAQNLNRATDSVIDSFTQWGGKLNRFLSASFTQYNPAFMIPNFFRDLQTALINLKAQADINPDLKGQDLSAKALKNLKSSIATIHADERGNPKRGKMSDYYQEFKEEGAKTGWANKMNLKDINRHVESVSDMFSLQEGASKGKQVKTVLKRGWSSFSELVDNANTSIENGIRLSTYAAARDAGLSKLDAASLAKELTINFNRKGEVGGLMNTLYLFFNASVQGTSTFKKNMLKFKTYEDSKGNIKKTLNRGQKAALAVQLASFALTLFNMGVSGDDEESEMSYYEGIPDYEKERNIIIMSPDGSGKYAKIPLPYGYNIFSNIGTMLAEVTVGNRTASDAGSFLLGNVVGSFAPFASPEGDLVRKAEYAVFPTVAAPVINLLENKDNFNNPIYRENFPVGDEKVSPAFLGSTNTPDLYKKAAILSNSLTGGNEYQEGLLGFHPDKAEFLVDYFGGGSLKFLKDTYGVGEKVIQKSGGANVPMDTRRVPLLNKVYGEDTNFPERNIYYNVKENYKAKLNYLENTEEGREESNSDKAILRRLDAAYDESDKKLKELRKIEKKVLLKEDSNEKLEKLEDIEVKKNSVYSKLVRRYLNYRDQLKGNYE